MGVGGIPYQTITAYCRDRGIEDLDDIECVVVAVQALDGEYLEDLGRRLKKQGDRGELGAGKQPRRRGRP